jgi:hypothetical protein
MEQDVGERDWEGGENEDTFYGLKLALTDGKVYALMAILFGELSSASFTNFFPTVVATLGYNRIISLLLTTPPFVIAVFTTFLNSYHADRTGERYYHITIPLWVSIVAFILAATTTTTAPRYLAMMLMVPAVYSGYVVSLAWITNTLPRPPAKRAAAIAAINAVSHASLIWTPFAYPISAGPRYVGAMAMNCGTAALSIIAATGLRWHLAKENKKMDRQGVEGFRYLL